MAGSTKWENNQHSITVVLAIHFRTYFDTLLVSAAHVRFFAVTEAFLNPFFGLGRRGASEAGDGKEDNSSRLHSDDWSKSEETKQGYDLQINRRAKQSPLYT